MEVFATGHDAYASCLGKTLVLRQERITAHSKQRGMFRGLSMKHKVFASFENEYNAHCVDVSQRADGSFGYEEFRRDAEDCGAWQSLASYSQQVFEVQAQALADANCCVNWPAIKARRVQALEALASLTQKSAVPRMRSGFFIELPRTGMALQTLISFWALRALPA